MALKRKWIASPNYSSRGGSGVRLVVIHTTEGASTIHELGNYFSNPGVQASSHVGIDDEAGVGTIGEYVKREQKAWTAAAANPYCVQAELCAYAKWSTAEWNRHPTMLENCARWIAEECARYDVPIRRLSAAQAQDGHTRGVCGHNELGAAGGGHWDPGGGFPWSDVLENAGGGGAPADDSILPLSATIVAAATDTGGEMPEYTIKDDSGSDGSGQRYAVYSSGLVRRVGGAEWSHVKTLDLPQLVNTDNEIGNHLLNYDRALRGLVAERD